MNQRFDEIPLEVWKLFDEIMDYGKPVRLLNGTERMLALSMAWGWNPPLMRHGSRDLLTQHGLAAVAWRRLLVKRLGAPLNRVGVGMLSYVPSASDKDQSDTARQLEAVIGEETKEILEIARSKKSASDRAVAICEIDRRYLGWESPQWAELLCCSAANVRKGKFWSEYRPRALEDSR